MKLKFTYKFLYNQKNTRFFEDQLQNFRKIGDYNYRIY